VEGTDLGQLIRERGALDPHEAADLIAQAASGLDAAHAQGLVHRDVKPANLLLPTAARRHVYLTDFGLAKRDGSATSITTTGHWLGTPDFAAPEQIEGRELDGRADVYALGCVLYTALTGRPPFADMPPLRKGWAHVHERPPALPGPMGRVLAKALEKKPADRYATAGELGGAACAAASGKRVPRTHRTRRLPTHRTVKLAGPRQRRRGLWAAVLGLMSAAVAVAVVLTLTGSSGPARRHASSHRAPVVPTPSQTGTVRCTATACTQNGHRVQSPIEDGRCGDGTWRRIDASSPPLLACVPAAAPIVPRPLAMPDLAGARLDLAEDYLDQLGIQHDTSGGGILGIIDGSAWQVCTTTPARGSTVAPDDTAVLYVDRSC
jgi:hypothetical protein